MTFHWPGLLVQAESKIPEVLHFPESRKHRLIIRIQAACLSAVVTIKSELATINENIVV